MPEAQPCPRFGLSDALDGQDQSVELVLSFLCLDQLQRLTGYTLHASFPGPLSHQKIELPQSSAALQYPVFGVVAP
jgi:hypothetical protein